MATKSSQYDMLRNMYDEGLVKNATDNSAQSLWNSLSYGYGKKADDITQQYNRAISQQDRMMQSRGLGRSSYSAQTLANMQTEKNKALADNTDAMIADWQNRLNQQQEAEAARKFQAEQAEIERNWKSGESALDRAFTTSEREANQAYNTSERVATQLYNTGEREATQRYNTGERQAEQAWKSGESALDRAQSQAQFDANLGYQRERAAVADEQWNKEFATSNEQWQKNFDLQKEQWNKQFDYTKMSDEQKINYNYVMYALEKGQNVSDAMLAKAGLSRADYNAMRGQVEAAGGVRSPGPGKDDDPLKGLTDEEIDAIFNENDEAIAGDLAALAAANALGGTQRTSQYNGTGFDISPETQKQQQLWMRRNGK